LRTFMLASVSTSTVGSTNQPGPSLRPPPTITVAPSWRPLSM
jgi:hypothetical protein